MNLFAKAWDMLLKALDPNNFNMDDLWCYCKEGLGYW